MSVKSSSPYQNHDAKLLKIASTTNGWNVNTVQYPGGAFTQSANGGWVESNNNGTYFFEETGRDEWSVYLTDRSRNVQIQLDLWKKQILYGESNGPKSPLYVVTNSMGGTNNTGTTNTQGGTSSVGQPISQQVINYNCNSGGHMVIRFEVIGNQTTAYFTFNNSSEVALNQVPTNVGWQFTNGNYHIQIIDTQATVRQGQNNGDTCYSN